MVKGEKEEKEVDVISLETKVYLKQFICDCFVCSTVGILGFIFCYVILTSL